MLTHTGLLFIYSRAEIVRAKQEYEIVRTINNKSSLIKMVFIGTALVSGIVTLSFNFVRSKF